MQMKKLLKNFATAIILSYLIISCAFCQKSLAISVPHLSITSTKYSVGDKVKEDNSDINEVEVGKTLQLYAIISHGNDMVIDGNPDSLGWFVDKTVENSATWKSSNTTVATVDNSGKVTGKAEGKTTITVEYSGEEHSDNTSATYEINVKGKETDNTEDWTDISKLKVNYEWNSNAISAYFSGVSFKEKHTYRVFVSASKTELENNIANGKIDEISNAIIDKFKDGRYGITLMNSIMCLNKDVYIAIQESYYDSQNKIHKKVLTSTIKVERPALPNYGTRMDIYFYARDSISAFLGTYNDISTKRTMKYKIGRVTNVDLLKTFKTDEKKAFADLYSFAKTDSGIYSSTIAIGNSVSPNPTVNLKLENGAYYYCYMIMDDENGKFYPIDDVAIYQAGTDSTMTHFTFASMKFDDNNTIPGTSSEDKTIAKGKLPYAGNIALGGATIALIFLIVFSIKKNKDFKDVK